MEMEVYYTPRPWTTAYEVITLDDSEAPPPKCFPCSSCNECLAGKEFFSREDRKFCWKCFEKLYGQKCNGCRNAIKGMSEMTFIYFDNRTWHRECFKCSKCGNSLEGSGSTQVDKCFHCTHCGTPVKIQSG